MRIEKGKYNLRWPNLVSGDDFVWSSCLISGPVYLRDVDGQGEEYSSGRIQAALESGYLPECYAFGGFIDLELTVRPKNSPFQLRPLLPSTN